MEEDSMSDYAWNEMGAAHVGPYDLIAGIGLGGYPLQNDGTYVPVKESRVLVPSDMYALGDCYTDGTGYKNPTDNHKSSEFAWMLGYQNGTEATAVKARLSTRQRHGGYFNTLLVDGHVEHMRPSKFFNQSDASVRRFNNDNLPHQGGRDWRVVTD
jgi:prepilin-type processing-associated H-X9-DG protein